MKYETIERPLSPDVELLTFELADQVFGIEIESVIEIRNATTLARLPHAPEYIRGVMNLRGAILPVMCLRERIGMPLGERDISELMLIVVRHETQTSGLLVDEVCDILQVSRDAIQPSPEGLDDTVPVFLKGLALTDAAVMGIFDVERVLPHAT
jgi:purine-binding chemotaxis protein CheW